jgi:hypothetical protein
MAGREHITQRVKNLKIPDVETFEKAKSGERAKPLFCYRTMPKPATFFFLELFRDLIVH